MDRTASTRPPKPSSDTPISASAPLFEEDEGQLGPDELPDPDEVVMNHEAKLHH